MDVAQRGTSSSGITSDGVYTVDRIRTGIATAGTWTQSQSTDVPSGQGFSNSLKMDCTTANASLSAGSALLLHHRIEGQNVQYLKYGTSSAKSITLSFWVKSNKTGTYIIELDQNANGRDYSQSYTISSANTWEKKTLTFNGDTSATLANDNTQQLEVNFWLSAGTDWSSGTLNNAWSSTVNANRAVGQVNLADSTSNEWYITGVQLEAGQVASDFEFLPIDVNEERCRRYFQKSYTRGEYPGASTSSGMVSTARINSTVTNRPVNVFFRPLMRATPTFTLYSLVGTSGSVSDVGTGGGVHARDEASVVSSFISVQGCPYIVGVSGLTAGDGMCFHYTADAEL